MLADLPLAQLRNFVLVAEHQSYQSAAGEAFRSQPAISKAVAALEKRLGALLFEPSRRTQLTPFGLACLPYARQLLQHHDRTLQTLAAMARQELGVLTIAAIGALAANWMPQLIQRFAADHPAVAIRVLDDNSENVERMVLQNEVDFGLGSRISETTQLTFTPLVTDEFGLVCSRTHPLAAKRTLRWSQLDGLPLIGTTAHRQLAGTPEARHLEIPLLHVSTMLTLLSMLHANVGVTVLARLAVPAIAKSSLAFIPLTGPRRLRTVGILRRAGQSLSPVAQQMADRLRAHASAVSKTLPAGRPAAPSLK